MLVTLDKQKHSKSTLFVVAQTLFLLMSVAGVFAYLYVQELLGNSLIKEAVMLASWGSGYLVFSLTGRLAGLIVRFSGDQVDVTGALTGQVCEGWPPVPMMLVGLVQFITGVAIAWLSFISTFKYLSLQIHELLSLGIALWIGVTVGYVALRIFRVHKGAGMLDESVFDQDFNAVNTCDMPGAVDNMGCIRGENWEEHMWGDK